MIKNIIFDFDGVILDSVSIKTKAFQSLFSFYPINKVDELIEYHKLNGGISRYKKIKYFFNKILKDTISEEMIYEYANKYSELTKIELSKSKYLIDEVFQFIKKYYQKYDMHIASGADEKDLKYICDKLNLTNYFISISGSPTIKSVIVKQILADNDYNKNETILIGDSINDYDAAKKNGILFYGYNNSSLIELSDKYLKNISEII